MNTGVWWCIFCILSAQPSPHLAIGPMALACLFSPPYFMIEWKSTVKIYSNVNSMAHSRELSRRIFYLAWTKKRIERVFGYLIMCHSQHLCALLCVLCGCVSVWYFKMKMHRSEKDDVAAVVVDDGFHYLFFEHKNIFIHSCVTNIVTNWCISVVYLLNRNGPQENAKIHARVFSTHTHPHACVCNVHVIFLISLFSTAAAAGALVVDVVLESVLA